jgi:hypothetical protein
MGQPLTRFQDSRRYLMEKRQMVILGTVCLPLTKREKYPSHRASDEVILIQTRSGTTASRTNDLWGP